VPDDGWTPVDEGESSALVLVHDDGDRYAKVVVADGVTELARERDRLVWAAAHGIAVAEVLHWSSDDDGACLTTRAVAGIPADRLEPHRVGAAWPHIVRAVRDLHETPTSGCPFDRGLRLMFGLATDVVARDAVNPEFLRAEQEGQDPGELLASLATELPRRLAQEDGDLVVCHGDLCLPNIVLDPESLEVVGYVDLGRLGLADRHADLSLLLANAQDTWPEHAELLGAGLASHYGHPVDAERLRFHLLLDPLTWG
jgi:streptomycin 3"-kinase